MASLERRIQAVEDALILLEHEYTVFFTPGNNGDLGSLWADDGHTRVYVTGIRTLETEQDG